MRIEVVNAGQHIEQKIAITYLTVQRVNNNGCNGNLIDFCRLNNIQTLPISSRSTSIIFIEVKLYYHSVVDIFLYPPLGSLQQDSRGRVFRLLDEFPRAREIVIHHAGVAREGILYYDYFPPFRVNFCPFFGKGL